MPDTKAAPLAPAGQGASFSMTDLALSDDLSRDDWRGLGRQLSGVGRGLNWWWGDWLNYGDRKYGETFQEAAEISGQEVQTLRNVAWVASRFEPSRRRDTLSWTHHAEVAALDPTEADRILETAERERWSTRAIREAVQRQRYELEPGKEPLALPDINKSISDQIGRIRRMAGMSQRAVAMFSTEISIRAYGS